MLMVMHAMHGIEMYYNIFHSLEILVNRGWVPKNRIQPEARREGQVCMAAQMYHLC